MPAEQIGLQAILEDKQFNTGLQSYMAGIDQMVAGGQQMQKAFEGTSTGLDQTSDDMVEAGKSSIDLAAQMYTVKQAFEEVSALAQQGLDLAKLGATSERIERRFGKFSAEIGGAEVALKAFQVGAGGAASDMEAMQSASMLLQMDLVNSTAEMEELVTIAVRLGDQTQSVTERTENFALMMANQSIPRLDSYGLSSGTVRSRINELMAATEDMTREDAFATAVREEAQKSLAVLGERVVDNAASFEIMEAKMANAKVELGQKLAPVFATAIDMFGDFGDQAYAVIGILGEFGGTIVKLSPMIASMGPAIISFVAALGPLGIAVVAISAATVALTGAYVALRSEGKKVREEHDKQGEAIAEVTDRAYDRIQAGEKELQGYKDIWVELDKYARKLEEQNELVRITNRLTGNASKTWQEVQRALVLTSDSAAEYNLQVERWNELSPGREADLSTWNDLQFENAKANYEAAEAERRQIAIRMEGYEEWAPAYAAVLEEINSLDEERVEVKREATEAELVMYEDLTLGQMRYTDVMDQAIVKTMDHGDALSRYQDAQVRAGEAAERAAEQEKEAAASAEKAAQAQARQLEELARAQDAAKAAAFRHSEQLLTLAERLSGAETKEALVRAGMEELKRLKDAAIITDDQYIEQVKSIQDTYGLVTEKGRFLTDGLQLLIQAQGDGEISGDQFNEMLGRMDEMAEAGKTDIGLLKDVLGEYDTPAEAAAKRTLEMRAAFVEAHDPAEDFNEDLQNLQEKTTAAYEPTLKLSEVEGALKDALDPVPQAAVDSAEGIADLTLKIEETEVPLDNLVTRIEALPEQVRELGVQMYSAGKHLVKRLEDGLDYAWEHSLLPKKEEMLNNFAEQFHSSPEPKDPKSPLRGFFDKGVALVQVYIDGLESAFPELNQTFDRMFTFSGAIAGLGGAAAGMMSKEQRAVRERVRGFDTEMKRLAKIWGAKGRGKGGDLYRSILEDISGGRGEQFFSDLMVYEGKLTAENKEKLFQYRWLNRLYHERNAVEAEYVEMQEKLKRLAEAQERLKFLEQQVALLKLIEKHGLDAADILGGLKLGAEASAEEVLAATTFALEQIVKQAEEKLGLHSPSTVFKEYGENMMRGMAMGIEEMAALPIKASQIAAQDVMQPMIAGMNAPQILQPVNMMQATIQAGGNTIATGMNEFEFEARVQRAVARAMRGY